MTIYQVTDGAVLPILHLNGYKIEQLDDACDFAADPAVHRVGHL